MNLLWFIQYLHIALGCVVPVLESAWIHGDREAFEYAMILPCIKKRLIAWGYRQAETGAFMFSMTDGSVRHSVAKAESSLEFRVVDGSQVLRVYSIEFMYPQNKYGCGNGLSFSDRRQWLLNIFSDLCIGPWNWIQLSESIQIDMNVHYTLSLDGQLWLH